MCLHFGTFRFCFLGGFQRRATALLGRKNPKKPAVSWQGIQRGRRPLGTRLCSQSLVCYTFAKGLAADGLFCPQGWGKRRRARAGIAERLQRKAAAWASTRAKGYRFPMHHCPQQSEKYIIATERGITMTPIADIIVIPYTCYQKNASVS